MPKILDLTVRNFRGIKQLTLRLDQKSLAILGPNGSGKSSVADAVDFLLTGRIRRLSGEGTKELSLAKHGPHLDAAPTTAIVEARFHLGSGPPVRVWRSVADPEQLNCDGHLPPQLDTLCLDARAGTHHLLTRKEILTFILAEPSSRAQKIAALLDLTRVEALRKALQGAAKDAADRLQTASGMRAARAASVLRSFSPPVATMEGALTAVNSRRSALGGQPLSSTAELKSPRIGLTEPTKAAAHPLQAQRTRELLDSLREWAENGAMELCRDTAAYLSRVRSLRADQVTLDSMRATELLRRGLQAVRGSECPLCLTPWSRQELEALLRRRLSEGEAVGQRLTELREARAELLRRSASVRAIADGLIEALRSEPELPRAALLPLPGALSEHASQSLPEPLEGEVPPEAGVDELLDRLLAPKVSQNLLALEAIRNRLPPLDQSQLAWDELVACERAIAELADADGAFREASRIAGELAAADEQFVAARDKTLTDTYERIAKRFSALYQCLNAPDEADFSASLPATKAGLRLEVAFHDRGRFPPAALHSEGHQDGMGLCLFLALAQHLSAGVPRIIVLDDVMMSVDQNHRRRAAELLRSEFPETQFVITTHDRVWWRQLRSASVVTGRNSVAFEDWTLEDGPHLSATAGDHLRDARDALTAGRIPAAAHALRRAVEEYFPDVCDALHAAVRFKADGSFEAGDFISAAMSRYSELVDRVAKSAKSWQRDPAPAEELAERRRRIYETFQNEAWLVNPTVHYNEWAQANPQDFAPVLDAYHQLFSLFVCPECGAYVRLLEERKEPLALRCECGKVNWNLRVRKAKV